MTIKRLSLYEAALDLCHALNQEAPLLPTEQRRRTRKEDEGHARKSNLRNNT